jgi:hypothetical protein
VDSVVGAICGQRQELFVVKDRSYLVWSKTGVICGQSYEVLWALHGFKELLRLLLRFWERRGLAVFSGRKTIILQRDFLYINWISGQGEQIRRQQENE